MRISRLPYFHCFLGFLTVAATPALARIDTDRDEAFWKNPPTKCIEELVQPDWDPKDCPDLSKETPFNHTSFWGGQTNFCYAVEAMRRESANPGSIPNGTVRNASVIATAHTRRAEKIKLIYESSKRYDVPPQMLFNLLNNESLTSEVGLLRDFDNYSCGTGSLNINQWCKWGKSLTKKERKALGFPKRLSCDEDKITSALIKPLFYKILPTADSDGFGAYVLDPKRIAELGDDEITTLLPDVTSKQITLIRSFLNHCAEMPNAIPAAAHMLRTTFDESIPPELKGRQIYSSGEGPDFAKSCAEPYESKYFPFQSGWVLAYAIHNVGEEALEIISHYYTDAKGEVHFPEHLTPQALMHAVYFGGKYDAAKNQVLIDDPEDRTKTKAIDWLWPCDASVNIKNMLNHSLGWNSPLKYEGDNDCNARPSSDRAAFGGRATDESVRSF